MDQDAYHAILKRLGVEPHATGRRVALEPVEARYRAVARRVFYLAHLGPDTDPAEGDRLLGELAALTDDLGPARADAIRHEEARRWWAETGCCPWCGEPGAYHEPRARP
jgi:hypothetical protein